MFFWYSDDKNNTLINESYFERFSQQGYTEGSPMVEGRCMKCKGPVEIKNGKEVTMKNGMRAMKGECPKCSTKVFRILGKAK